MLLTTETAKLTKSHGAGFLPVALYLAPGRTAGRHNMCPKASPGCLAACLFRSGRAGIGPAETNQAVAARVRRTRWFTSDREAFMAELVSDVEKMERKAQRSGLTLAVRLNGTSDIPWERVRVIRHGVTFANMMAAFPAVTFYDYTKRSERMTGALPVNYSLTFSRSEVNGDEALDVLQSGGNVAVVFSGSLPDTWHGFDVIDGDKTDLRFLDPRGVVVGLVAKGPAKRDTSGFVVTAEVLQ